METTRDHTQVTGTRVEIIAALEDRADGWDHMGSPRKRDRALGAAARIRTGSSEVKVGPITYRVREAGRAETGDKRGS